MQYRQKRFGKQSEFHNVMSLVRYMTKYIVKSFDEIQELDIPRYIRAHHIAKPKIFKQFLWSSWFNNQGGFVHAVKEVFAISNFLGLQDIEVWNPNEEMFILRGVG